MSDPSERGPLPVFGTLGAAAVIVGIVVGTGIFRLPTIVAQNSSSAVEYVLYWVAGGVVSLLGALCYAELATNHPDTGGEYHFLRKSFGDFVGFLFTWGRMTVIQTGSITLAAFILGDYATEILSLGSYSSSLYAGMTVLVLTGVNLAGTRTSKTLQNLVTGSIVLILVVTGILGIAYGGSTAEVTSTAEGPGSIGTAMIFVLLTYGGWNEGVYLSAELSNVRKEMIRSLLLGLLTITVVYVLVNAAYLKVLGLEGLRTTDTIGVELTERIFGTASSNLMAVFVVIAALSTINASILTGARTNYALGRDFDLFAFLGEWNAPRNTPGNALLFQGAIALALVGLGTITQEAVATMVDYTAPVFWFFIFLTTASLFVFRWRGTVNSAYRVPLYPVTPILFLMASGYLLYSSVMFTGTGALVGIGILVLGVPLYYVSERWW